MKNKRYDSSNSKIKDTILVSTFNAIKAAMLSDFAHVPVKIVEILVRRDRALPVSRLSSEPV